MFIGNTTANATMNVTNIKLINSTANLTVSIPTTTQANGSHYLNGNGSWTVPAGGGGGSNTVFARQNWTANSTVNTTFTVSAGYTVGQLDVYQNGVKLLVGSDVDASDGSTIILTTPAAVSDVIEIVGFANAVVVTPGGSDTHVQFNDGGVLGGDAGFIYNSATGEVTIANATHASTVAPGLIGMITGGGTNATFYTAEVSTFIGNANDSIFITEMAASADKTLMMAAVANSYVQASLKNYSSGNNASGDFVITADNGNDTVNYVNFGINGSTYANASYNIGGPLAGYMYVSNGALTLGALTANDIIFHSNGAASTNEIARFKNSGGMDMVTSVLPAAPAAGRATIFVANVAGRNMPSAIGNSGISYQFQPHMGRNRFVVLNPVDNAAAPSVEGMAIGNTVALTARALATSNNYQSQRKTSISSNATAALAQEVRGSRAIHFLGNAAGVGGFHFFARAGVQNTHANASMFVGLSSGTGNIGNNTLSANSRSAVGFGFDAGDTAWHVVSSNATTASKATLGSGFPCQANQAHMYEFMLFAKPNSTVMTYRVVNVSDGNTTEGTCNTACQVAVNTLMSPRFWLYTGAGNASTSLAIAGLYVETDN